MSSIQTIPAGLSFVDVLARGIFEKAGKDPLALARMQIFLPTRRACRSLREAFLRLSGGKPLLLPRMNPVGDVEEEDLSLIFAGAEEELSLPSAISSIRRRFLLCRLIAAQGQGRGIEQDMALAGALARLMDQVYTEDLDLADLPRAVEREDFSAHWQISIDFLSILSQHWPLILAEQGMMDRADRRNRLLKKFSAHWRENPPSYPVIAAGSTGSIPATADFLKTVSGLPEGVVVLPGLDQVMDAESWEAMDDTHPQATLRQLLKRLGVSREDVSLWPSCERDDARKGILRFVSEVMRPAETTQAWQTIKDRLSLSSADIRIERYDCASLQEEALVIALALRETLEDPTKTAALVTPDRKLARRVAMTCRRWGIEIDDSAGQSLSDSKAGTFLQLCMEAVCAEMKPVALLDFCKHALCLPEDVADWRGSIRNLDVSLCRGPAFQGGMKVYAKRAHALEEKGKNVEGLRKTLSLIERSFQPLFDLMERGEPQPFSLWCEAHIRVAEKFSKPEILWAGQDGEAASLFLSGIREESALLPPVTAGEYLIILQLAMKDVAVRPAFGLHPRLMILGQLEARLVEADLMILSGLNEGMWPPDSGLDPWMSRPMRKRFGLPSPERSVGLSAHDFAQGLCAKEVVLTRSLRVDGTPTVPSRWLQRMDTVLAASGLSLKQGTRLAWARSVDHAEVFRPLERPCPRPPVAARPRKLSVTKIETWMNDPYSIYARYILKLRPLDALEKSLDAAMKGEMIHKVLDRFVSLYPDRLPPDAQDQFMKIVREELESLSLEGDVRNFWEPRLLKMADWIVETETSWRETMLNQSREDEGSMVFEGPEGPFTIDARADRIDQSRDGTSAAIIDYKSGGNFSKKGMQNGKFPQLPLESLILEEGGFNKAKKLPVSQLSYWIVNGGKEGGSIKGIDLQKELDVAKENARAGVAGLITVFDDERTPYYSLPYPENAPEYNDYKHLARVSEWTALDEEEDES